MVPLLDFSSTLGLEVVKAESGDEALLHILRRDFAVVIMDLLMPRMNGFEVSALIRGRDRCRDLPIVILSGFDEDGAKELPGYRPGAFESCASPCSPRACAPRSPSASRASRRALTAALTPADNG